MVRSLLTHGDNLIVHLKVEKLDPTAWDLDATLVIFYCKCNLYYELCQKAAKYTSSNIVTFN